MRVMTAADETSMGPRLMSRGGVHRDDGLGPCHCDFNGAATHESRRRLELQISSVDSLLLQWGRDS